MISYIELFIVGCVGVMAGIISGYFIGYGSHKQYNQTKYKSFEIDSWQQLAIDGKEADAVESLASTHGGTFLLRLNMVRSFMKGWNVHKMMMERKG